MNKKNWISVTVIMGILLLLGIITYFYMVPSQSEENRMEVSVIVYGNDSERWTAFRQGAEQAAQDAETIINFVTMAGSADSQEQQEAISREMMREVEGLVLAVVDSARMSEYLIQTASVVPVVLAESKIENDESITFVGADGYQMGKRLAEEVLAEMKDTTIHVIQTQNTRSCQNERLSGFLDACQEAGVEPEILEEADEIDVKLLSRRSEPQILIALDDQELEMAAEAIWEDQGSAQLYGIGSSENIVYALDRGVICGIIFQNEFNMGYEAVDILLQKIRKGGSDAALEIDYHWATRETLHDPENERLLYPIIQ